MVVEVVVKVVVIICGGVCGLSDIGRSRFRRYCAEGQSDALVLVPAKEYGVPVLDRVLRTPWKVLGLNVLPMAPQFLNSFDENFVLFLKSAWRRS